MEKIVDRIDCCGCSACATICAHRAITMVEDEGGFLYPTINQKQCVNCGLCKTACPILKREHEDSVVEKQLIYACHNNDVEEWKASSSGGMFRILADYVIDRGGYVVGAVYDDDMVVRHVLTDKCKELEKFRGSKYVQSDTRNIFMQVKEQLVNDNWILFTGTPCQVEALKCYLRKPYEKLITCDIICTSVPSPRAFKDYIMFLEKKYGSKVVQVNMKDKTKGWPYAKTRIFFENGESIFDSMDADLWIKAWSTELMNRPSCEHCRFTNYNRSGDITIGDCWSVFHKKHAFSSPNGISQLMINTEKGKKVFEAIKDKIALMPITKEFAWQSKLEYPIKNNPQSVQFWVDYRNKEFKEIARIYWDYSLFKYYKKRLKSKLLVIPSFIKHKILKK